MAKAKKDIVTEALSSVTGAVKKSMKGEQVLHSNKAINHIGKNYLGAAEYVTRGVKEGSWDLMKTFGKVNSDGKAVNAAGELLKEGEKQALNYGKIAGSYIGASVAARVVTGGGITRDSNGNSNLIGVPFV